jgi:hypothetical protein
MNWQTITTAPKDGTKVLGYALGAYAVVFWHASTATAHGYWTLAEPGSYAEDTDFEPAWWQPLPPPPEAFAPSP